MTTQKNITFLPSSSRRKASSIPSAWVAAALIAGTPGAAWSDIIAYNFSENPGNQGLDTTTPKGPTGTSVWNDSNVVTSGGLATGTETGLVDDSNTATSASIAWSSSNVWWNGSGTGDEERRVVVGYLDDGGSGVNVQVNNIPFAAYNVYGIVGSDEGAQYVTRDFQVNGTWVFGGASAATADAFGDWDAAGATWVEIAPGSIRGNYWKMENVTGSSLTIQGQPRSGSQRGCLSAIVIEEATFSAPSQFDKPGITSLPAAALGAGLTSVFRPGLDTVTLTDPNGLSAAATHSLQIIPAADTASGTYTLFDYDGTFGGGGFAALQVLPPANTRYGFQLLDNTTDTKVDLLYTAPEPVVWTGATDSIWNTATANWKLETGGTATTYQELDVVKFKDLVGTPSASVDVPGTVTPLSVLVDNSATAYTLGGAGAIDGAASLTKQGTGTLTLTGSNTYTGAISILGGTLSVSQAANLGSGGASLTLDGGTLASTADFNTGRAMLAGAAGAIVDVAAATTLGVTSGGFKGGNTLVKTGAGTLAFSGYGAGGFNGALDIEAGTVSMGGGAFNGNIGLTDITVRTGATLLQPAGAYHALGGYFAAVPPITLEEGATYQINQENYLDVISLTGATVQGSGDVRVDDNFAVSILSSPTVSTWAAALNIVNADAGFYVEDGPLAIDAVLSGNIVGANGLHKNGPGTMEITGAGNTYSGETVVGTGTLVLGAGSSLPSPLVQVDAGATLDVSALASPWVVLTGKTLAGNGTVTGNTDVDGTVAPGASAGTLTFTDELTLFGASTYDWEVSSWDAGAVAGTDYDLIVANSYATLNTAGNPIVIKVDADALSGFTEVNRTFTLIQAGGPFAFNAADYTIDASAFQTATGAAGTWSVQASGNNLQLVYTAQTLTGYALWASQQGFAPGEDGADFDADFDGLDNGIEWVVGGDPTGSASNALAPTVTVDATHMTFVFRRTDDAAAAGPFVEYGSTLGGWTEAQGGVDGVVVNETNDGFGAGVDRVEVKIPRALAVGNKLFARLRVEVP